jgi:hypothetical protein
VPGDVIGLIEFGHIVKYVYYNRSDGSPAGQTGFFICI